MIAEFALRSALGRREVREDKCDELRLGELNGNRRRSWAFCHIAHRKWVDVKPERSSPESLTIAYNTKGYGTRKTRNHLMGKRHAAHPFEDNPFVDDFLEWMGSSEREHSVDALDRVYAALENADVDARQRKIVWDDGQRLTIEQSAERIRAENA